MKKVFVIMLGLMLIISSGCSQPQTESRSLSEKEIQTVNEAFEPLLPANKGDMNVITSSEGEFTLNPISHFFTSYYDKPENLDIGKFVYYIPRETFVTPEDEKELEKLKELEGLPFDNIDNSPVPFGRIPFATVEQYLKKYMNVSLDDMTNMGDALYLEEYETFYSYASDFGPGIFHCTRGEINGDVVTLYSKNAVLTLKKDDTNYYIISHVSIE
jgi:hypothetical protein